MGRPSREGGAALERPAAGPELGFSLPLSNFISKHKTKMETKRKREGVRERISARR